MRFLCEYTEEEILKVVAEHAGKSLPVESSGTLRANREDNGRIKVYFIPNEPTFLDITKLN